MRRESWDELGDEEGRPGMKYGRTELFLVLSEKVNGRGDAARGGGGSGSGSGGSTRKTFLNVHDTVLPFLRIRFL